MIRSRGKCELSVGHRPRGDVTTGRSTTERQRLRLQLNATSAHGGQVMEDWSRVPREPSRPTRKPATTSRTVQTVRPTARLDDPGRCNPTTVCTRLFATRRVNWVRGNPIAWVAPADGSSKTLAVVAWRPAVPREGEWATRAGGSRLRPHSFRQVAGGRMRMWGMTPESAPGQCLMELLSFQPFAPRRPFANTRSRARRLRSRRCASVVRESIRR